jgi:hypothetical protein
MTRRGSAVLIGVLLLSGGLPVAAGAVTGDPVILNEALVWHTGPDTTEFFELYGTPGTPLSGLSVIVVEGDAASAGTLDLRVDLPAGARLGGNGFYLVGGAAGLAANYSVTPDLALEGGKTSDWVENGSETLALAQTATLGSVGSPLTGGEVVFDVVGLTDGGFADAWFFAAPVVGPDDTFAPPGVRRPVDGADTDTPADFALADDLLGPDNTPTPSTPYDAPPTADCGPAVSTVEGTAATATVTATDPDGRIVSFTVSPEPADPEIVLGAVTPAAEVGDRATAEILVGAAAAQASYSVTIEATNDGTRPQSATCVLAVNIDAAPEPPAPPAPSLEELGALLDLHVGAGDVAPSKAHLLTDRLERVERLLDAGESSAAAAQLQAFSNQVAGLSPQWVTALAADALAAGAEELRATVLG